MSQEFEKVVLEKLNGIDQKLDEHTKILNEHTKTLDEHTEEFKKVNQTLDLHTKILDEHTKTLDEHTKILNEHTKTLDEHTKILNEHTKTLDEHTKILNEHTKTLDEHTENFKVLNKDIYHIKNSLIKNEQNLKDVELIVEYNRDRITELQKDVNKNANTIFSALDKINSRLFMKDTIVESLKTKNFEHEIRISNLEDKMTSIDITA